MSATIIQDTANTSITPNITVGGTNNDSQITSEFSVHTCPGAPTAADGGAGSIGAGTYVWAITQVNAEGENSIGAKSNSVTLAASHQANLTAIPTGPTGTTSRKVYRSSDNGVTWGLVGTIANNTATTFTDNLATPTTAPPATQSYHKAVKFNGGTDLTNASSILQAMPRWRRPDYRSLDI